MANAMSITPPSHDSSQSEAAIFLPAMLPTATAAKPAKKARAAVLSGEIPQKPQLSPVAAESSELASARAAASDGESDFEPSVSAAVSSR